jgi:hypothetical protein
MAERKRGGGGSGAKDQQIRQLTRQLEEANERADSLKRRLDREKGPIMVGGEVPVRWEADAGDPGAGTLTIGAHPAEQAFTGSQPDLVALFDRAADMVEAATPAPVPEPEPPV